MQRSLRIAKPELEAENYEFVSIAVIPGLQPTQLATYADQQGFDWTFSVASNEFLSEFIGQFGRVAITTPNMVHFVIQPDGTVTRTYQGVPSPEQLIAEIREASVAIVQPTIS